MPIEIDRMDVSLSASPAGGGATGPSPATGTSSAGAAAGLGGMTPERLLELLRPLVRMILDEELTRHSRGRG